MKNKLEVIVVGLVVVVIVIFSISISNNYLASVSLSSQLAKPPAQPLPPGTPPYVPPSFNPNFWDNCLAGEYGFLACMERADDDLETCLSNGNHDAETCQSFYELHVDACMHALRMCLFPASSQSSAPNIPGSISIGDRVETTLHDLNIRSTPSGALIGTQPIGSNGTVIGGPTVSANLTRWQVDFAGGVDGWTAEKYLKKILVPSQQISLPEPSQQINPPTSQIPAKQYGIGVRVKTTLDNLNIRETPSGTLLGTQPIGGVGVIIDGPGMSASLTRWKIDFDSGVDGWTAERYLQIVN